MVTAKSVQHAAHPEYEDCEVWSYNVHFAVLHAPKAQHRL